ncbi:MAG TPA: hypothetical protein VGF44_17455 [Terriglobales bacterium]
MTRHTKRSWFHEHSLSIVSVSILVFWVVMYTRFDPNTHWGSFFGNAIADWSGVVVTVIATKYFYELGSAESRRPPKEVLSKVRDILLRHSLSIFLIVTGIGWVVLFTRMNPQERWGQVVGNVVSEWTQILGMVILTKRLIEKHSKESRRD